MLSLVKTASLPMATPCSLAPISAPHIHQGRESTMALVEATWGMSIQVQRRVLPASNSSDGTHSRNCASFGSRSLFLANRTPWSVTLTIVSHIAADTTPEGDAAAPMRMLPLRSGRCGVGCVGDGAIVWA